MNYIKTNNSKLQNRYWIECNAENKPFIRAEKNGKYYHVWLDLYSTIFDLNKQGRELIDVEFRNEFLAVQSQKNRKTEVLVKTGNVSSRINQVLPKRVDDFCEKLYAIVTNPQNTVEDMKLKEILSLH
ncbi:MAG: hypothetical protein ISR80_05315 [Nitrosopumilus sp.]|nr:hypothetical protein [Nitrosopumilus sp.]